jgi:hypothetical protein
MTAVRPVPAFWLGHFYDKPVYRPSGPDLGYIGWMKTGLIASEHERGTVKSFIVRDRQERLLSFVNNPKNRRKFTQELAKIGMIDKRFATSVPWKVDPALELWARHTQGIRNIAQMLRSKGAGQTCWVISDSSNLDGQERELESVLEDVIGGGSATILSCLPGRLAYYSFEHESLLLQR